MSMKFDKLLAAPSRLCDRTHRELGFRFRSEDGRLTEKRNYSQTIFFLDGEHFATLSPVAHEDGSVDLWRVEYRHGVWTLWGGALRDGDARSERMARFDIHLEATLVTGDAGSKVRTGPVDASDVTFDKQPWTIPTRYHVRVHGTRIAEIAEISYGPNNIRWRFVANSNCPPVVKAFIGDRVFAFRNILQDALVHGYAKHDREAA